MTWRGTASVVETVEQALTLIGCAYLTEAGE